MFWLLKKIFTLGVLAAIVFFALQFHFGGKSLGDYVGRFLEQPYIRENVEKAKKTIDAFLPHSSDSLHNIETPMDDVKEDERRELEGEIQKSKH